MNRLIEAYLRAKGVQYFRGHLDDEYFFLVHTYRGHLNVHLEVCGPDRDGVQVSISPDRYYPADRRERLAELASGWNAGDPGARVSIHDSCDPRLVGISVHNRHRPADGTDLTDAVDATVASAIEVFGRLGAAAVPGQQADGGLRDAG